jgi:hypothetical protein
VSRVILGIKKKKKWVAKIMLDGKSKNLGGFEKEEDARNGLFRRQKQFIISFKDHILIVKSSNNFFGSAT